MRAAVLHNVRDIRLADMPRPVPQDGDVLVQVKAVGVCGSDIHSYVEGSTTGRTKVTPYVLGHELAGVIPPESAKLSCLPAGTLVAVDPARPCLQCEWCHRGHTNLCPHVRFLGYAPINGALAEFVSVAPSALHPVPRELEPADAAILETLGVAIHAIDLARIRFMETVAVLGCGAVGLLLVQLARLSGAGTIVAVDPLAYRTKLAMEFGANVACKDYSEVATATDGRRADLVLEATDSALGFDHAVRSSRIGGRLVLVGIPDGNEYILMPLRHGAADCRSNSRAGCPKCIRARSLSLLAEELICVRLRPTASLSRTRRKPLKCKWSAKMELSKRSSIHSNQRVFRW